MSRLIALALAGLLLGGCETIVCPDEPRDPRSSGAYDFGFCD